MCTAFAPEGASRPEPNGAACGFGPIGRDFVQPLGLIRHLPTSVREILALFQRGHPAGTRARIWVPSLGPLEISSVPPCRDARALT
jgi:hypothetical protein